MGERTEYRNNTGRLLLGVKSTTFLYKLKKEEDSWLETSDSSLLLILKANDLKDRNDAGGGAETSASHSRVHRCVQPCDDSGLLCPERGHYG